MKQLSHGDGPGASRRPRGVRRRCAEAARGRSIGWGAASMSSSRTTARMSHAVGQSPIGRRSRSRVRSPSATRFELDRGIVECLDTAGRQLRSAQRPVRRRDQGSQVAVEPGSVPGPAGAFAVERMRAGPGQRRQRCQYGRLWRLLRRAAHGWRSRTSAKPAVGFEALVGQRSTSAARSSSCSARPPGASVGRPERTGRWSGVGPVQARGGSSVRAYVDSGRWERRGPSTCRPSSRCLSGTSYSRSIERCSKPARRAARDVASPGRWRRPSRAVPSRRGSARRS